MIHVGFLCSTSTQVQTFLPVIQVMDEDRYDFEWICLDNYYQWDARKALKDLKLDYALFGEYDGRRFIDLSLPEMYQILRGNIAPQISSFLRDHKFAVLVFGNDRGLIEKQFIHQAKSLGIKTALIQDGILWTSEVRSWRKSSRVDNSPKAYARDLLKETLYQILVRVGLSHLAPTYIGQGACDVIAVIGQSTKRILTQRGVDIARIYVTGQPRYDRFLQIKNEREEIRRKLDLPDSFIIAVFTSAYNTNLRSRLLQSRQENFVNEFSRKASQTNEGNVLVLFKPHPRESLENYKSPADENVVRIVQDVNSIDIIAVSDVVVSVPSTIIVEVCLFRKPLFVLNLNSKHEQEVSEHLGLPHSSFEELNVAVNSEDSLDQSLWDKILSTDKKTSSTVCKDLIYVPEDGAANQVANLLESLVAQT